MPMLHTADWLVIAGGIGAIGWVLWYFFLAERAPWAGGGRPETDRRDRRERRP